MPIDKPNREFPDRQAVLQSWLDENRLTRRSLSRWIGIDPSYLTHILAGKRNCTRTIRVNLESVGFPMELVPKPVYRQKSKLITTEEATDAL